MTTFADVQAPIDEEALRRKKRQGTETRKMVARLQVRYDPAKLQALEAVAGKNLHSLIRDYGDLLTELLPVADERGVDPIDLMREVSAAVLAKTA
ncbi:hypothetical protein [Mycobacterium sp.]|jgi:hypothetical protein|uniref:hypothetical protein n=1 Tax=Mycobacterium sp. TaxID=1785 RepID=UPI0025F06C09|nr:hypothetical protein [Mycobacterium sp.]